MGHMPPSFGGEPGEPVPEVDPDDVKTTWEMMCDFQARHPGQEVQIGASLGQQICKPGANVEAVGYRLGLVSLIERFAPEQWAELTKDGQMNDAFFHAAATVPMEWIGAGVRQGLPFDFDEFMRRVREH